MLDDIVLSSVGILPDLSLPNIFHQPTPTSDTHRNEDVNSLDLFLRDDNMVGTYFPFA